MALISSSIPNLINGVSQQPYTLRLASQATEQINCLSSVAEGLKKRPPSRHIVKATKQPIASAFSHVINRDGNEQYILVIRNGALQVFDLFGTEREVKHPDGYDYLLTENPETDIAAVTVADYTFILNKSITVEKDEDSETGKDTPYQGLIWIKQGAYSTEYKISVDGETASFTTPYAGATAAEQSANSPQIQTSNIAKQLVTQIQPKLDPKGIEITQAGSTILFSRKTSDFPMAVYDALGDTSLKLVKGSVQTFSDLPARAFAGMKIRIAGTDSNAFDDYWVEYKADETNPYGGLWQETVKDGEPTTFLGKTMPHLLVRDEDGNFSFEEAVFEPRSAGDSDSAPLPSFVGRKMNGVLFHRNRLAFLADENIIFSRAGDFFNFFRTTAIQTLDTDPIDVAVTTTKVSILKAAVPFNETLMLFSDESQFQIAKTDLLTPKTIGINLTTSYTCNTGVQPVGAGANVYFAQTRGGYAGLREYYVDPVTAINDATDVTAHCPTYIPGAIRKMAACTNENMIACLSGIHRDTLYIYKYYWSQQTKLQSSWSKWVLTPGSEILDVAFINSSMLLVVSRPDGVYIEAIDIQAGLVDADAGYLVYLDRRMDQDGTKNILYHADTDRTQIACPYGPVSDEDWALVIMPGDATYPAGKVLTPKHYYDNVRRFWTFFVPGNVTKFRVGVRYSMQYTFSPFIMREQAPGGQGMQAVTEGRLQVRHLRVAYSSTGYFQARVTPQNGKTYTYTFSGLVLGDSDAILGMGSLATSQFQFPIASRNDQVKVQIVNDSHLPSTFLSAEWEGFYTIRSRRM